MANELGRLLREARVSKGYSIFGFAKATGLSATTVSMAENGRTAPYGRTLKAFAETLGLDLGQLITLTQQSNKKEKGE